MAYAGRRVRHDQYGAALRLLQMQTGGSLIGIKRPRAVNPGKTAQPVRTSQLLREILIKNPRVKHFTVKQILESIGNSRHASLLAFSVPAILPVAGSSDLAGLPAGLIAGQMAIGRTDIKLPKFILERTVSRRSLTVAIRAVLPVLELAEKATKPRWLWLSRPSAQRILAMFIFILALAITIPFVGANVPHAAAIFIISLGLAEQDGWAIALGVLVGAASLIFLIATSVSGQTFRPGSLKWAKVFAKALGLKWIVKLGTKLAVTLFKKFALRAAILFLLGSAELRPLRKALARPAKSAGSTNEKRRNTPSRKGRKPPRLSAPRLHAMDKISTKRTLSVVR
jgi:hypothetical protein